MKGDLTVSGPSSSMNHRIAASATRFDVGEPLYYDAVTLSSGAASANTAELMDADGIVLATDTFAGVALKGARPFVTGTVVAHETLTACPIGAAGLIEGKAETAANIDTAAELIAITGDVVLIDYDATGASDGGPLYTIQDTATADTSAFTIRGGNTSLGTLKVSVDVRAYRMDNDIS